MVNFKYFNDKLKSKVVLNNTYGRPPVCIQTPRERNNFFLFFTEKRNCPKIRKEMVTYKFRIKTTSKCKLANCAMVKCCMLVREFSFILCTIVNTEFMRKLFF